MESFDVIVIGGGHAGCEAAASSARVGAKTALITNKIETIGALSCNPAMGGIGKGHLIREIDALDGIIGRVSDLSGIHFQVLNKRKGPAVQGPRAQIDRELYALNMKEELNKTPGLTIIEGSVDDFILEEKNIIKGVICEDGKRILANQTVLTTGTFLNGIIHCGKKTTPGGRVGEAPSRNISNTLKKFGLTLGRLKTGTPARLFSSSIDYSSLEIQNADKKPETFSYLSKEIKNKQLPCYITRTTEKTHKIIIENIMQSSIKYGNISGVGPRYCPSIEDKVERFSDKNSHQIFLEPEGLSSELVYPNGISTSLPEDVQDKFLRTIPGNLGGAVKMNAGCYGSYLSDYLIGLTLIRRDGSIADMKASDFKFSYRNSNIPDDAIITNVLLRKELDDPLRIEMRMTKALDIRNLSQPTKDLSCGSTFRNPLGRSSLEDKYDNDHSLKAWKLIDDAGLRGAKIGGAMVSKKHTNFLKHANDTHIIRN